MPIPRFDNSPEQEAERVQQEARRSIEQQGFKRPDPQPSEPLEVTSPSAWRQRQVDGFPVKLPSGNVVRMRRTMDIFELLKAGQIPNPLAAVVNEAIRSGGKKNAFDIQNMDEEAVRQLLTLIENQLPKVVIEPKVLPVPEDKDPNTWRPDDTNALSVAEIDLEDRMFIYGVAQGGAADLESFRAQPEFDVASAPDVGEVQPTS